MTDLPHERENFSLVLGGPLYQLLRRSHLTGDTLELVRRRVIAAVCLGWLPLLVLSTMAGRAFGHGVELPFLHDIEAHARFLIALPVLILAELVVHLRIRTVVLRFVQRGLIPAADLATFDHAVHSTIRLRNSIAAEVGLVILVYSLGLWVWRSEVALGAQSWYAVPVDGEPHLTAAGYWYAFVSIPFFQFILLRWYYRLLLWFHFLWRVSRIDLALQPTHPDRAGGLGFLGNSTYAFGPILFAQGAVLAGLVASKIFYAGQDLMSFKVEIAGFVAFFVVALLVPLMVFSPQLARAKRNGLADFGALASRYARAFEHRWLRTHESVDADLLGSADIQSLADLGNSYSIVQEMRFVPFGLRDVTRLAVATALPLAPLALTIYSLDELVSQLVKVLL